MALGHCPQAGCPLGTTGKCLEGFEPPSGCPHFTTDSVETVEPAAQMGDETDLVDLPSGEALRGDEVDAVTRSDHTKLVVVAGPYDSGKTTILTSTFESFLDAPISNFQFRGSRTLVAFERRCHDGRVQSGRERPATTHTSMREGVAFLHLELASTELGRRGTSSLLMTDISGELFGQVRDLSEAAENLECLRRADHFCLAIDGEAATEPDRRQQVRTDSRSILRSILEARVLPPQCTIDIVITKWDRIVERDFDGGASRIFVEQTVQLIKATAAVTHKVRVFEVAARPTGSVLSFAHGIPTLLRAWMRDEEWRPAKRERAAGQREMSRFGAYQEAKSLKETRQ